MARLKFQKFCIALFFSSILSGINTLAYGQSSSGFSPFNRLGVSYQQIITVDLGLGSYSILFGRRKENFFDLSVGFASIFDKSYVLAPKINLDMGAAIGRSALTIGGGVDVSMPNNFSHNTWMLTPKLGLTAGSVIRLYYGRHIWSGESVFNRMGKHQISLELNTAAFHDFKIGL